MTAITFDKTWNAEESNFAYPGSTTNVSKELIYRIKVLMTNHNWTVVSSSNSTTADNNDNWSSRDSVVGANPGTAHSWIVLKNAAIATNFQVCFDMYSSTLTNMTAVVSYNAGFSGGTTTNRPTATDETIILAGIYDPGTITYGRNLSLYYSSDFKCTRIFFNTDSPTDSSTSYGSCFIFDTPKDPVSWWDEPFVAMVGTTTINYSKHNALASPTYTKVNGERVQLCLGSWGISTGAYGNIGFGDTQDANGAYVLSPIPLISLTSSRPGILGMLYDIYWVPSTLREGAYIPTSAGPRRLFVIGNIAQANNGDIRSI